MSKNNFPEKCKEELEMYIDSAHDDFVKDYLVFWGINPSHGAFFRPEPGVLGFAHSGVNGAGKNGYFSRTVLRGDYGLDNFYSKESAYGFFPVNGGPGFAAVEHRYFSFERRISPPIWSVYDHYPDYNPAGAIIHDDEVLLPNDRFFIRLVAGFAAHAQRQLYMDEDGKSYRGFNPWVVPNANFGAKSGSQVGKISALPLEFVVTGSGRGVSQPDFTPGKDELYKR